METFLNIVVGGQESPADVTFTCVQNDEKEPAMQRAAKVSLQKRN